MPSTRSGRNHARSSPAQATSPVNKKRKAETSSPASQTSKRGKNAKEQKTIEETIDPNATADVQPTNSSADLGKDDEQKTSVNGHSQEDKQADQQNGHASHEEVKHSPQPVQNESKQEQVSNEPEEQAKDEKQDVEMTDVYSNVREESLQNAQDKAEDGKVEKPAEPSAPAKDAVQTDAHREQEMPSNILEKGIIYFFTRGRVGIDEPESVQDLQRSYFVLRPLPKGGKITDGIVQDSSNSRLLALPKKVWPKSGKDRFMVFVEKAKVSMASLKTDFFQGSEYNTQTSGVRHTPPVSLVGEGVYALTTSGGGEGTTHLVYMLTVPHELGQVQDDVGLAEKGSFVLSLKNPEASGPSYASLPEKPEFPKEFIEEFRGRGWMSVRPKHLDYPNAQLLIIGESFDSKSNLEQKPKDEQDQKKESPEEELEKLENEDEHRVEALRGDDTVFADLGISKKEYGIMTTW